MRREEFRGICESIKNGEERFVENLDSHQYGKILSCNGDQMEVERWQKNETWSYRDCKEASKSEFDFFE